MTLLQLKQIEPITLADINLIVTEVNNGDLTSGQYAVLPTEQVINYVGTVVAEVILPDIGLGTVGVGKIYYVRNQSNRRLTVNAFAGQTINQTTNQRLRGSRNNSIILIALSLTNWGVF